MFAFHFRSKDLVLWTLELGIQHSSPKFCGTFTRRNTLCGLGGFIAIILANRIFGIGFLTKPRYLILWKASLILEISLWVNRVGLLAPLLFCKNTRLMASSQPNRYMILFAHMATLAISWGPFRKASYLQNTRSYPGLLSAIDRLGDIVPDNRCPFCNEAPKSTNHLFFSCRFTLRIWDRVRDWCGFHKRTVAIKSSIIWIRQLNRGTRITLKGIILSLVCTIYHIWRSRNATLFDCTTLPCNRIVHCIISDVCRVLYELYPIQVFVNNVDING